jgi:hypothetical protein
MRRADSLQPATVSAYGANRVATQQDQPADIAAIFRGDHFRVISRRTCQNPRDFSKTLRGKKKMAHPTKAYSASWMPRILSLKNS